MRSVPLLFWIYLLASCLISMTSAAWFKPRKILHKGRDSKAISTAVAFETDLRHNQRLSTSLRDLTACFEATKSKDGGIHVGRLLEACEKLAVTVRRIGFATNAKDLQGNIDKIRTVYNQVPAPQRDSLSVLLQHELAIGGHGSRSAQAGRPSLQDPSAIVGALWLGRAIRFQQKMFGYLLDHPTKEPYDAATIAYEGYLQQHHSRVLRKAYRLGLSLVVKPMRRTAVLSGLGGFSEATFGLAEADATSRDLRQMLAALEPLMTEWDNIFADLGLEERI